MTDLIQLTDTEHYYCTRCAYLFQRLNPARWKRLSKLIAGLIHYYCDTHAEEYTKEKST